MNSVLANISRISPQLNAKASSLRECVLQKGSRNSFGNSAEFNASRAISRQCKHGWRCSSNVGINKRAELNVTQPPQKSKKLVKPMPTECSREKDGKQTAAKKIERGRQDGTARAREREKLRKQGLLAVNLALNADVQKSAFVRSRHVTKAYVGKQISETLDKSSNTLLTMGQQGNKSTLKNVTPTVFRTFITRDYRRRGSNQSINKNSLLNEAEKDVKKSARIYNKGPLEELDHQKNCETQLKKTWKEWVVNPQKFLTKAPAASKPESQRKQQASELNKEVIQIRDVYAEEKAKKPNSPAHKTEYDTKYGTPSNGNKSERSERERIRDEITDLSNLIENITKSGL